MRLKTHEQGLVTASHSNRFKQIQLKNAKKLIVRLRQTFPSLVTNLRHSGRS